MEFLGVGPSELIFILIIALIILGPRDMQKAGKTIGKWMRDIVTSDGWKIFQQTSREIRTLPTRLMREANEEMGKLDNEIKGAVGTPAVRPNNTGTPPRSQPMTSPPPAFPQNKIAPPVQETKEEKGADDQEKNEHP
jgi:sec-independent protein translocase protein TatB